MKKYLMVLLTIGFFLFQAGNAAAFFIDFESGTDGAGVDDILGVSFESFNGYSAVYGDSRTGSYNTYSDDLGIGWNAEYFHHNGYNWLWADTNADARGVIIDFTYDNGTWFTTGYSSYGDFTVEAFFTDGTSTSVSGGTNSSSAMDFLTVYASSGKFIDYIVLSGASGNTWLVDDMSGDTYLPGSQVPVPPSLLLLGTGLVGLTGLRYRFKK